MQKKFRQKLKLTKFPKDNSDSQLGIPVGILKEFLKECYEKSQPDKLMIFIWCVLTSPVGIFQTTAEFFRNFAQKTSRWLQLIKIFFSFRSAMTLCLVMGIFVVCWLPFFIWMPVTSLFELKTPRHSIYILGQ